MPRSSRVSQRAIRWQLYLLVSTCVLSVWGACALVTAVPARAEGRAQTIHYERRDYTVTILPTGGVSVVEHWQVHVTGDPIDAASLQIYLAHTTGIDFGQIAGASGQTVMSSYGRLDNPVRRVDWTFPPTQDAPHNFDIPYTTVNATHSFDIPYTIHGALGITTNQAWFDWHFVMGRSEAGFMPWSGGENIDDECTITLIVPATTRKGDLSVHATYQDAAPTVHILDATTVQIHVQRAQGIGNSPIEVMTAFPRSDLNASVPRQSWQMTDVPPTPPTSFYAQLQPLQRTPYAHEAPGPLSYLPCAFPCILVLSIILVCGLVLDLSSAWTANRRSK